MTPIPSGAANHFFTVFPRSPLAAETIAQRTALPGPNSIASMIFWSAAAWTGSSLTGGVTLAARA